MTTPPDPIVTEEEQQAQTSESTSPPTAPADSPWSKETGAVLEALSVSPDSGLTDDEAQTRLDKYGSNRLREIKQRSTWAILIDQFKSLIIIILIAAALISFARQNWIDGGAIVVVLLINTIIGFITELRATRSIEALREMDTVDAKVRRNGHKKTIPAEELVPGDIVILESGELVSADIRLLKGSKLQADESALTGESVPVDKQVTPVEADAALADRHSMLFKGTAITRGQGEGVVVASGMNTEIGEISALVESAEDEETPLEERLDQLGRKLVGVTLGVAAAIGLVGLFSGRDIELMIETAIALAIAAVPEGLPIVATVALARGMWRMLKRNALMRKLSSVETLGATNIICTDKTGTLTENQMTVTQLALVSNAFTVNSGSDQLFQNGSNPVNPAENPTLQQSLRVAMLCNDAELQPTNGQPNEQQRRPASGDPMEVALIQVGQHAGLSRDELLANMPEVERDAFDRETKQMATVHQTDSAYFVAVKGAPKNVLTACSNLYHGSEPLTDSTRQEWLQRNRNMAADGLRVLALATKTMDSPDSAIYENLQFLGLVGLIDPPRQGVKAAIERCQEAGIRVVMVTGDQPATAQAIAHAVGLVKQADAPVIRGTEFDELEKESAERREEILNTSIFARVTPAQKLDLIDLHQAHGSIVAMTGDGVNDAPALKSADIGIAMGQRGTQVAREAADMILQDDAFPTIVAAVEQGRVIFDNIRKFVIYLLSGNVGVILAVALATLAGAPLPLLPLQILYLNMINDVFPALALGIGNGNRAVMDHPPRDSSEPIITRLHWAEIVGYGALIGFNLLLTFYLALTWLGLETAGAITVTFLTLSISRLLHAFNMRNPASGLLNNEIVRNPFIWGALGLSFGLLLLAVYWTPLAGILELTALGGSSWLLVVGASVVPLIFGQLYLRFFKSRL